MSEFDQLLLDEGVDDAVGAVRSNYLLAKISPDSGASETFIDSESYLAEALEAIALASEESERDLLFHRAFLLRRNERRQYDLGGLVAVARLAADGVLANRSAEVLMLLRDYKIPSLEDVLNRDATFAQRLHVRTIRAFLLLVRRSQGWNDVRAAAHEIRLLREEHVQASPTIPPDGHIPSTSDAVRLVSGFNLAKIVDLAATFTAAGIPTNVQMQLDRHADNRDELSKYGSDPSAGLLGDLIQAACRSMVQASIWTGTNLLGKSLREFVAALASPNRADPLFELWPSQRAALDSHLLDPARRAVVVEMPTSAGKTLIAEFSIVQALALNPGSSVVYVVPTRALVNQITQRLRRDLAPLGVIVESAIPVIELDPTEDALLQSQVNVLITTPEKLDLLLKSGHVSVASLSLAVIDEAHNLSDGVRGARLELLLGMMKRERPETRFLLLTPFVPNADQLAAWLGDGAESTIAVDWRPSERIAVTAHWKKPRSKPYQLTLTTLASAGNVDVEAGREVIVGQHSQTKVSSKSATTVALADELAARGGVLILVRGKGTAESRSRQIAATRQETPTPSRLLSAVISFAQDELGEDHLLPHILRRRVAYHHAGLSHDMRYLVEQLIDRGDVDVVAGTTTLAQGLNFPISSVIVETLTKSQGFGQEWKDLTYSEFWNIAGRAGRAMRDPLGLVAFPCVTKSDRENTAKFLSGEAALIASSLLDAAAKMGENAVRFDLKFTRENPDIAVFLQYLTHVTRLAGAEEAASELEDILRSSLVFHQARQISAGLSRALLSVARKYIRSIQGTDRGFMALADGTGFSLASANMIYAKTRDEFSDLRSSDFWSHENLFVGDATSLTKVVSLLGDVPELSLGLTASSGSFDPEVVAGVVRDWVSGKSVTAIADRWFNFGDKDREGRLRDASAYIHGKLVGQVPWGIGAVQKLILEPGASDHDLDHTPSFVFYGVSTREAVLMRMGGVPRSLAHNLGDVWGSGREAPRSFQELRTWIGNVMTADWGRAGAIANLSGDQAKLIWDTLVGSPSIE
ncbi:DEAD/DEAH box helicase [Arthrobacter sp. FW306-2-2C-D06B]|uniref:DEAD/DEAH box helicase n=2 Tax=Bacteria TaxID=2 RepID=UPI001F0002A1|nr:DEAD/DEAH box helicase [Arthrobacter sp. FW306-2-2C-D06B]UKA59776.1 DEAD/DEAH box helicase [Arthrobacter sp. FW306-2-2C-D06B]